MKKVRFFKNDLEERQGYYIRRGINEFVIAPKDKKNKFASIYDFENGNFLASFNTVSECVEYIRTCKDIHSIYPDFINELTGIKVQGFVNPVYNKQRIDNIICIEVAMRIDLFYSFKKNQFSWVKFRNCSAEIAHTNKYILLKSYDTIVAVYDLETDIVYDFLRYNYGFTSTSCQHINKFIQDYKPIKVVTYRDI